MIRLFTFSVFIISLVSCSNSPELETGEIRTFKIVRDSLARNNSEKRYIDARKLINREQIDRANIPVLFVELESGQNGTLTLYPGKGVGQTWLGADGATITFENGILKASRGMGDDVMGGYSSKPNWNVMSNKSSYDRKLSYLKGNNQIYSQIFNCKIDKVKDKDSIVIWEINFFVRKYEETCHYKNKTINNTYYVDDQNIVRKSYQFHSLTLGHISTERLDLATE